MSDQVINAAGIPRIDGDMDALVVHAREIGESGTAFADTGERVHLSWQGLGVVYRAPEAGQLMAATAAVAHVAATVGEDHRTVAAALQRYADEVRAVQSRLDALRAQAVDFERSVEDADDWQDDESAVGRHAELVNAVNAAMVDFQDAERRCANAINAIHGMQPAARHLAGDHDTSPGAPADEESGWLSGIGHAVLDVAGLIPLVGEAADGVNALWYLAEGDDLNAGLSAAAMIPLGGWFATGAKAGVKGAKAASDVGPHTPIAPQGGLRRHENAGGHTLDPDRAHVGASDQQLLGRLENPRISQASSYYDRASAERAASENIAGNSDDIQRWLQSGERKEIFDWQHDQPVGRYVQDGVEGAGDVSGSRVVLRRDPSMPDGYRIQSTFPRP